jgi:trafficking protein particle complex subunit 4
MPESAEEGTPDMDTALTEIYILYCDCALKDPFYELEMPIRSTLFTQAVDALMDRLEKAANAPTRR